MEIMPTPEGLEREHTLTTAVVRYTELRGREAFASTAAEMAADAAGPRGMPKVSLLAIDREESLEMLALGEAIARKAAYGQQLGIRSARRAGASWAQIGAALGISKQSAWEAHTRWIDEQAAQHGQSGHEGFDAQDEVAARALAGDSAEESAD